MIVISGPTASGKTRLAIRLALLLGGEIVSADSIQVRPEMRCFQKEGGRSRTRMCFELGDFWYPCELESQACTVGSHTSVVPATMSA